MRSASARGCVVFGVACAEDSEKGSKTALGSVACPAAHGFSAHRSCGGVFLCVSESASQNRKSFSVVFVPCKRREHGFWRLVLFFAVFFCRRLCVRGSEKWRGIFFPRRALSLRGGRRGRCFNGREGQGKAIILEEKCARGSRKRRRRNVFADFIPSALHSTDERAFWQGVPRRDRIAPGH